MMIFLFFQRFFWSCSSIVVVLLVYDNACCCCFSFSVTHYLSKYHYQKERRRRDNDSFLISRIPRNIKIQLKNLYSENIDFTNECIVNKMNSSHEEVINNNNTISNHFALLPLQTQSKELPWWKLSNCDYNPSQSSRRLLLHRTTTTIFTPLTIGMIFSNSHRRDYCSATEMWTTPTTSKDFNVNIMNDCNNGLLATEQAISGAYQQVCMLLPERIVPVQTIQFGTIDLIIQQQIPSSGTTGMAVWNSSILLSRLLQILAQLSYIDDEVNNNNNNNNDHFLSLFRQNRFKKDDDMTTIIELGCGTGLCSIVTSIILGGGSSSKNVRIISTDGNPMVLKLAKQNIIENHERMRKTQLSIKNSHNDDMSFPYDTNIETSILSWGIMNAIEYSDIADLIIGSDLTYYSGNWPVLAETMSTIIKPNSGIILYVTLGHSGFNVLSELENGFLQVALAYELVPLNRIDPTTRWTSTALTELIYQTCSGTERNMIHTNGGVKAIALCHKQYKT